MTQANSALSHVNGVLRAHHLPFRLRASHNNRWFGVYAPPLPGRRARLLQPGGPGDRGALLAFGERSPKAA